MFDDDDGVTACCAVLSFSRKGGLRFSWVVCEWKESSHVPFCQNVLQRQQEHGKPPHDVSKRKGHTLARTIFQACLA